MKQLAIIFHSGFGHTEYFAKHVAEGAGSVPGIKVSLLSADEATKQMEKLVEYDGFVFGTPTYMGNVSAGFKAFMDASGGLWMQGALRNKWAAGFTVSSSPSGDKLNTLQSLAIYAAQHGMLWISNHIIPEVYQGVAPEQAANRLGSFLGAMGQAVQDAAPETSFVPGDLKTARLFGERVAQIVSRG